MVLSMPTEKPIINFAIDLPLQKRLDDYRFEQRLRTQSEAIRQLLDDALTRYEAGKAKSKK